MPFFSWRPSLSVLPWAPAQTLWLLLTLPGKLYWGLGTTLLSVGLCLSSESALFCAVPSVSSLGSPAHRDGRDLTCNPPPAPPIQSMGSLRPSQLTPRGSLSQGSLESKAEFLSSSISSPRDRSETHISQSTSRNKQRLKIGSFGDDFIQIPISEMEKLKPECTGQGQERDSNPCL